MNIVILAGIEADEKFSSQSPPPICGKPMICHVLDAIATFKESHIVVVVPPIAQRSKYLSPIYADKI